MVWRTNAPGLSVVTGAAGLNEPRAVPPGYCTMATPEPPLPPRPPEVAVVEPGAALLPDPPPPPPVLAVPEVAPVLVPP